VSVTRRERALERGHVMDADVRKAERREADKLKKTWLAVSLGQRVRVDAGDDAGRPWGCVVEIVDADRVLVRLDHGGVLVVSRGMLRGAA
jgi:hypothetical protein